MLDPKALPSLVKMGPETETEMGAVVWRGRAELWDFSSFLPLCPDIELQSQQEGGDERGIFISSFKCRN